MIVKKILFRPNFKADLDRLDRSDFLRAEKAITFFRQNPLHPSIRLHRLHGRLAGYWSISVTDRIRIIFERYENGDIVFLSIGKHDIYKSL